MDILTMIIASGAAILLLTACVYWQDRGREFYIKDQSYAAKLAQDFFGFYTWQTLTLINGQNAALFQNDKDEIFYIIAHGTFTNGAKINFSEVTQLESDGYQTITIFMDDVANPYIKFTFIHEDDFQLWFAILKKKVCGGIS